MQNRTFLVLLRPIFAQKMKTAPPQKDLGAEVVKELPWFGRKNRLNLWFRAEDPSQFWWRPFSFGDLLFLGGKTVWVSDFGQKTRINFDEDLFFFFFFLEITYFWAEWRAKQWKFGSRSLTVVLSFQIQNFGYALVTDGIWGWRPQPSEAMAV